MARGDTRGVGWGERRHLPATRRTASTPARTEPGPRFLCACLRPRLPSFFVLQEKEGGAQRRKAQSGGKGWGTLRYGPMTGHSLEMSALRTFLGLKDNSGRGGGGGPTWLLRGE